MRHEGLLGATFADGGVGAGYAEGKVLIVKLGDRDLEPEEYHVRPDNEITGWAHVCSCGWRGTHWRRAATPRDQDLPARRVWSPHPSPPMDTIDLISGHEYGEHIAPVRDDVLASLPHLPADRALTAVGQARELGASWTDIATAAGLTPEDAHARWQHAPVQVFTRRHGAQLAALTRLCTPAD
ncbi:hypothetical protein [Catenuloplanes atrovinosus]|uniref:Uncharacterized protein n=1 Tax=Catenuloplanes atrovinosus TaxID=137266 RepID=A0AAE3YLD3_9ACTN|nr:hypothetical protein [Catenuloplanes atrovinosus]MDR7275077.1 hypothetical protein [Catenuloplanes atrovinosus]